MLVEHVLPSPTSTLGRELNIAAVEVTAAGSGVPGQSLQRVACHLEQHGTIIPRGDSTLSQQQQKQLQVPPLLQRATC